jgi:hypothetical protein
MILTNDDRTHIMNIVYEYIDKNCIFRCKKDEYYSAYEDKGILHKNNGLNYKFYIDRLTYDSKMLYCLSALFFDDILKKVTDNLEYSDFQLMGTEESSIPLLIGIQQYAAKNKLLLNCFTIKKQRSDNGIFNLINGIPNDSYVIFIDNVLDNSVLKNCYDVCVNELNLKPAKNLYSILKYDSNIEKVKYNEFTININSPYNLNDFNFEYDETKYWIPKECE